MRGPKRRLGLLADRLYEIGPIIFSWSTFWCGDWTLGITYRRAGVGSGAVLRVNLGLEALCFTWRREGKS